MHVLYPLCMVHCSHHDHHVSVVLVMVNSAAKSFFSLQTGWNIKQLGLNPVGKAPHSLSTAGNCVKAPLSCTVVLRGACAVRSCVFILAILLEAKSPSYPFYCDVNPWMKTGRNTRDHVCLFYHTDTLRNASESISRITFR